MSDEPSKQDLEDSIDKIDRAIGGDRSEDNIDALKQALDYDWPEIQKSLIGDGVGLDSWWLDKFERKDVLLELPGVVIMNTKPWHCDDVAYTFRETYAIPQHEECDDCFTADDIQAHIDCFPEGQFIAMRISGPSAGHAIAMASTTRTSRPPTDPILPWLEAIGGLRLGKHEDNGEWLYGVEMAVYPMYQRHGIGTGLYEARFQLTRRLNLRGWYAVGMLMGYQRYADNMGVAEYGERVITREIKDPTVSLQIKLGFRPIRVVPDYCDEPAAGDAGVLIVWENPDYES